MEFDGRVKARAARCHSIDYPLINLKSNYTLVKTREKRIDQRFRRKPVEVLPLIVKKKLENRKLEACIFRPRSLFSFFFKFFFRVY